MKSTCYILGSNDSALTRMRCRRLEKSRGHTVRESNLWLCFGNIESAVPRSHSFGEVTFGIVTRSRNLWREGRDGYVDFGVFSTQIVFKILNLKQLLWEK